jgi:thiamine transporter ThiT
MSEHNPKYFRAWWHRRQYRMGREEYVFIGLLTLACLWGFGLGLIIGFIWGALL